MKSLFRGKKGGRLLSDVRADRSVQIFPQIHSFDPKTIQFNSDLGDELSDVLQISTEPDGSVGRNGVSGNFYGLRTVGGYEWSRLNLPPKSNAPERRKAGLVDGPTSQRHEDIWDKLGKLMFSRWEPSSLKLSKPSSTGFPSHEFDPAFKVHLYHSVASKLPQVLDLIARGEWSQLYNDHDLILAYNLVKRLQVDKVTRGEDGSFSSKQRLVNTYEYAISSGRSGTRVPADKSVTIEGVDYPNNFAMRVRTAYGLASGLNYQLASFMTGLREVYLKEYEYTWKHRAPESIESKLHWKHVQGFDVAGFDTTVAPWMLEKFLQHLPFTEEVIHLFRRALSAPYYSGPVEKGIKGGLWLGNPFEDKSFNLQYGLPSGVACNPDVAKYVMTASYLCLLDDFFHDTLERMEDVLQGNHPQYGLLNMGDDTLLGTNHTRFHEYVVAKLESSDQRDQIKLCPYFVIEKESPVTFLGNVVMMGQEGERSGVKLAPNIVSFFLNWFTPERSVTATMREFWALGWKERKIHYAKAPSFSQAWEIMERRFYDAFGVLPDTIADRHYKNVRSVSTFAWSEIDREVLENPAKLYYKYTEEDVSPEVLDLLVTSIDASDVERYVTPFLVKAA